MKIEKIAWGGWPNCYKLSDEKIELIVTTDVGPRIIYCGLVGGENVFYVDERVLGQTGADTWVNYGGHRLWHAPEDPIRTYVPDNSPVAFKETARGVEFVQDTEKLTGIRKSIHIEITPQSSVLVDHLLHNHSDDEVSLAVWGLSVMKAGGVGILPLPPRGEHPRDLLPNTTLIAWPYTDFSDPRFTFGREYLLLQQDSEATTPQKIGGLIRDGWLGYLNAGTLFIKKFGWTDHGTYPDLGCNAEMFTNAVMLEVESLSCMHRLRSGTSVQHREEWSLHNDVSVLQTADDVRVNVLPFVTA